MQCRRGSATVSDGFRDRPRLPGRRERARSSSEYWPRTRLRHSRPIKLRPGRSNALIEIHLCIYPPGREESLATPIIYYLPLYKMRTLASIEDTSILIHRAPRGFSVLNSCNSDNNKNF